MLREEDGKKFHIYEQGVTNIRCGRCRGFLIRSGRDLLVHKCPDLYNTDGTKKTKFQKVCQWWGRSCG